MKTYIGQMKIVPGAIKENLKTALDHIRRAKEQGAQLVVLPEMCLTGYMIGDKWYSKEFLRDAEYANDQIREASAGLLIIFGSVRVDWDRKNEDGTVRKYNAALVVQNRSWVRIGKILEGWIPKTNLPNYGFFDDKRYFTSGDSLARELGVSLTQLFAPIAVTVAGDASYRIGVMVCEDMWDDSYANKIAAMHKRAGANLLVNISCSPWHVGKQVERELVMRKRIGEVHIPIIYVNSFSLQDNGKNLILVEGGSVVMSAEGCVVARARQFGEEGLLVDSFTGEFGTCSYRFAVDEIPELYEGLITAIRMFFTVPKVVIGLSGGVDSAVMAALLVDALGSDRVVALNMPSQFNSERTQNYAQEQATALGIEYHVIPIQHSVELLRTLLPGLVPGELADQNAQAKMRGVLLTTVAQLCGGFVAGTGNKTELALNYATLYGDLIGAASFLADIWKGKVYALGRYINQRGGKEKIPTPLLDPVNGLVPSAELSTEHDVNEEKGDPIFYPFHDVLLKRFSEDKWGIAYVLGKSSGQSVEYLEELLGCPEGTIRQFFSNRADLLSSIEWAWRGFSTAFKHVQAPPVFVTSGRAYGYDYREAVLPKPYYPLGYKEIKEAFLASPW